MSKKSNISLKSQTHDNEGRLLVTHLKKGEDLIHVVNINGPNTDDPVFWNSISSIIETLPQDDFIIVAGDFNIPLDPIIDRQSNCHYHPTGSHAIIQTICFKFNLKDYTFYSTPHNSYTRIDYILISGSFTHLIEHSGISPRLVSDPSCISVKLAGIHNEPTPKRWRFNNDVLTDPEDKKKIEEAIIDYLKHNDSAETNINTLWNALKATIRGIIIKIKTKINKRMNAGLVQLEHKIKTLESSHTLSLHDTTILTFLTQKKYEYNKILSEQAGVWINKFKALNVCEANKAGKLLASYLKHKQNQNVISTIKDVNNQAHTKQRDILNTFKSFYEELYKND